MFEMEMIYNLLTKTANTFGTVQHVKTPSPYYFLCANTHHRQPDAPGRAGGTIVLKIVVFFLKEELLFLS